MIPPRAGEPRQVPTAEAKALPNLAPRGPWEPTTHTHTHTDMLYSSESQITRVISGICYHD